MQTPLHTSSTNIAISIFDSLEEITQGKVPNSASPVLIKSDAVACLDEAQSASLGKPAFAGNSELHYVEETYFIDVSLPVRQGWSALPEDGSHDVLVVGASSSNGIVTKGGAGVLLFETAMGYQFSTVGADTDIPFRVSGPLARGPT